MRPSIRGLDVLGLSLALVFVGWIGVAAAFGGGRPGPMAALVLGVVAAVAGAHRISRIHPIAGPALVAASPILAGILSRSLLSADPLGYTNASGALFFIAACGAVLVGLSVRGTPARIAAYLVAAAWILAPWTLQATAAGLVSALLPLAVILVRRREAVRAVLLAGAGLAFACLLAAAVLGSVGYRPGDRANIVDRAFDAQLGQARVVLWGDALDLIRSRPLTGVGPGRFRETSPTAVSDADLRWAHNEYLQVAAETGIPGAILLVSLVVWAFARLWLTARDVRSVPAVVAFVGILLHANIEFIWHFPEVPLALGLLVGAGSAVPQTDSPTGVVPVRTLERTALVSTLALWLVLLLPFDVLSPSFTAPNGAAWVADGPGITFAGHGVVRSRDPARRLHRHLMTAQAFAIEAWVATYELDQHGPARIVSASEGTSSRNFTLGQAGDRLVLRLRTTRTNQNATDRQIQVPDVFVTTDLQHIVVTTDLNEMRVYVDGALRWSGGGPGGRLDNWSDAYPLLLGNETGGERPWLGEIRFLALYDQTLSGQDVRRAFGSGGAAAISADDERGPRPVALYAFLPNTRNVVPDRSNTGLGPELEFPARVRTQPRAFARALVDAEGWSADRFALHALLFGLWAGLLLRTARNGFRLRATSMLVVLGGPAIALGAGAARYLAGRLPSLADLLAALTGCAVASLVIVMRLRFSKKP